MVTVLFEDNYNLIRCLIIIFYSTAKTLVLTKDSYKNAAAESFSISENVDQSCFLASFHRGPELKMPITSISSYTTLFNYFNIISYHTLGNILKASYTGVK